MGMSTGSNVLKWHTFSMLIKLQNSVFTLTKQSMIQIQIPKLGRVKETTDNQTEMASPFKLKRIKSSIT